MQFMTSENLKKKLILAGGGHAHVMVLKKLAQMPLPGFELTLISESAEQLYSGMLPGYIRGAYKKEEITFDLRKLCGKVGVQFIEAKITGFDKGKRLVKVRRSAGHFKHSADDKTSIERTEKTERHNESIEYDLLSVNLGAQPSWSGPIYHFKPFHLFLEVWEKILSANQPRIAVVGGGAAGVELSLAMNEVIKPKGGHLNLYEKQDRLVACWPEGASQIILDRLRKDGVEVQLAQEVRLNSEFTQNFDFIFGADGPNPPEVVQSSGWSLDDKGYLLVDPYLRVLNEGHVFATGDMVTFSSKPHPKSGVYAIRQSEVLCENLWREAERLLRTKPLGPNEPTQKAKTEHLKAFRPQKTAMYILNLGRKEALLVKGSWFFKSRWVWKLKDCIDRRFMRTGQC